MEYLSINEVSQEWKMSKRRIQILCKEGRILGAKMIGNKWVIPRDAEKPLDARKKSPIKLSNSTPFSKIRKELKNVLKHLYVLVQNEDISEDSAKKYILAVLSVSLIKRYSNILDEEAAFKVIYRDLSWNDEIPPYIHMVQRIADDFVEKYENDKEIDDIISWAYQYFNKIGKRGKFVNTQFFTERYMTKYLVDRIELCKKNGKIVDPCCGGGNFLVGCLENLFFNTINSAEYVIDVANLLYGFDVDKDIAKLAVINIKIRCLSIMARNGGDTSFTIWKKIKPNIYCDATDNVGGSLADLDTKIVNVLTGEATTIYKGLYDADFVLTNPPYETIKGMNEKLKNFLKVNYPEANCDTCVAFILAIHNMLKADGKCGIVCQNAWMYLKSFEKARNTILEKFSLKYIADLGSGAFYDISGEKSNVALILMQKGYQAENTIRIANITEYSLAKKAELLSKRQEKYNDFLQTNIKNGKNGFDYKSSEGLKSVLQEAITISSIAVAMQGTSTGNAKQLVGFFWEHFNDSDWVLVSKGGGYCRWQGLNNCVVKWGKAGEYIKQQKGSAIRNARYFDETDLVFSDTGTAGLNVRKKIYNQIFIASGPGIRVNKGKPLAQLAYLNSRLATYYIRVMSPKLTIAAGYIGKLPICEEIYTSIVLEKNAELCLGLKNSFLSKRPNNYEYNDAYLSGLQGDIYEVAYSLFVSDMEKELLKLEIESHIDTYILSEFGLSEQDVETLEKQVGMCAFCIENIAEINLIKFDKYLSRLLDDDCTLKKTKTSKSSMGCDGLLEYVAKDLNVSPKHIVKCIQMNQNNLNNILNKYCNLLIHNEVLMMLEYNTQTGAKKKSISYHEINKRLQKKYEIPFSIFDWLREQFDDVHVSIFKGSPFIRSRKEKVEVIIND